MKRHEEAAFEAAIEDDLVARRGYSKRIPSSFNESLCLFPEDVIGFLMDTQRSDWSRLEKLHSKDIEEIVLRELHKELDLKGTLYVLRHGFRCYGKTLKLAYFPPNSKINKQSAENYSKNRLTITRQVSFLSKMTDEKGKKRRCVLDITIALNGVPVVTAELKNPLTGQCAEDAKRQYMYERDSRDLMFDFKKRALVHFALDTDEVWMTTRVNGRETHFLPFNRGNEKGAGNPVIDQNYKTSYLWNEVLERDSLLDILQRFIHLEKRADNGKRSEKGIEERMIFPRYHQLDAVRKLVAHAKAHGAGKNYLIQHSAGSGKSNTIAWLSHRLASLHNEDDEKIFHSVIVVTDRLVLDQQLQDTIYQFDHKNGVVEKIDKDTKQLTRAISKGAPIVISTIQKFPYVARSIRSIEEMGESISLQTAGKRYAVIVDEAHSSQTGEAASSLRGMLNRDGIEDAIAEQLLDLDDDLFSEDTKRSIMRDTLKKSKQSNISYFAFTATPKYKTRIMFDETNSDGESPFHEYTMKQAIQEGFILDVLRNYTTYRRFYGLANQYKNNQKVPKKAAISALTQFQEIHPHNIDQIITIIVEHFRANIMHEIGGKAKAMVVTSSRSQVVRYKLAFDKYIREMGYVGIKSLVAFSGPVEDPDLPDIRYTEVDMNDGLPESELPETFEDSEFRILLVAEKYQTGFDQPLLQAMYVVKSLSGVQAVQTLSRLNRVSPGKTQTFVLDFVNREDDIRKAFMPYYESTPVGEDVTPEKLNELQYNLLEWAIFTLDDVNDFSAVWYREREESSEEDHRIMNSQLDKAVANFKEHRLEDREQFRKQLIAFRNLYSFLSQVILYPDYELERFNTYCRNLISKLPPSNDGALFTIDDEVALKYYRIKQISQGCIDLSQGEVEPLKAPTDLGSARSKEESVELRDIVKQLNERFGTNFTHEDQLFFDQVREFSIFDKDIIDAALVNKFENFSPYFDTRMNQIFDDRVGENEEIYRRVVDDKEFRALVLSVLSRDIFDRIRRSEMPR